MGGGFGDGPWGAIGLEVLENLIPHLRTWYSTGINIAIFFGVFLVVAGLFVMGRQRANPSYAGGKGSVPLNMILAGIVLTNIAASLNLFSQSLLLTDSPVTLSYTPPNATSAEGIMIQFSVYIVQLIGLYGYIKGWVMLRHLSSGGQAVTFGQAIAHILGGVLAVNIVAFLNMVGASAGQNVHSVILQFFGSGGYI